MSELTHEIAASQPERYKVLSNGAIYDLEAKRIAGNPGGGTTAITQSNASALATQRWEEQRQVWMDGGQVAADELTSRQMSVWFEIGYSTAKNAIQGKGRVQVEAARLFGQNAGYTQQEQAGAPQTVNIQAFIGNDAVIQAIAAGIDRLSGGPDNSYGFDNVELSHPLPGVSQDAQDGERSQPDE